MAKNNPIGDGRRIGAVRDRSQTQTPSGHYVKRDAETGRFMDVKTSDKTPFKGVRRENPVGHPNSSTFGHLKFPHLIGA